MSNSIKKISFILATNRPWAQYGYITIKSIYEIPENPEIEYEIVVCSPFPVYGKNIVYVEDKAQCGVIYATNLAVQHATGDLIINITDDLIIKYCKKLECPKYANCNGANNIFDIVNEFTDDDKEIGTLAAYGGQPLKTCTDITYEDGYDKNNQFLMIRWAVVKRSTINNLLNGWLLHPAFLQFFADHWSGVYVAKQGWRCFECDHCIQPFVTNPEQSRQSQIAHHSTATQDSTILKK